MSLDVNVRALLDQMKAAALPKLWELAPSAARAAMKSRLLGGKDAPIGKTEERRIPGPEGDIPVRVYTPLDAKDALLRALSFFTAEGSSSAISTRMTISAAALPMAAVAASYRSVIASRRNVRFRQR